MTKNPRRLAARRGFTILETASSAALLSILVLAAFGASQMAMRATSRVASLDAADARSADTLTRLRRLLMPASLSTLEAVPSSPPGAAVEPMQDGVVYDNLQFRVVAGFTNGARVYVPALGAAPWRLWFQAGAGSGALYLDDGSSTTALLEGVRGASFTLTGRSLSITLQTDRTGARGQSTCELRLAILIP
jgi:hypothetical protein